MLSQKTLQMLLPFNQPEVTFAHTKHLWMSGQHQEAYNQLDEFLGEYLKHLTKEELVHDDRRRLLARLINILICTISKLLLFLQFPDVI